MKYQSTKTYGHEEGLSCCFRQWRARSHCNLLHGYSLSFRFVFEADTLDDRNWVVDFGGLKVLKLALHDQFDHKTVIAADDPYLPEIQALGRLGVADVVVLPGVGCEKFAELAWEMANDIVAGNHRVRVVSCECAEHGANSAIYYGE
jgi:6-pyruvoyltetrahydropterin/6-carboxytetrahydropterin synthase